MGLILCHPAVTCNLNEFGSSSIRELKFQNGFWNILEGNIFVAFRVQHSTQPKHGSLPLDDNNTYGPCQLPPEMLQKLIACGKIQPSGFIWEYRAPKKVIYQNFWLKIEFKLEYFRSSKVTQWVISFQIFNFDSKLAILKRNTDYNHLHLPRSKVILTE